MLLDGNRARDVFRKVRDVLDEVGQVCLAPDRPDLPVEEFQRIVSRLYGGLPIEKVLVEYEGENMLGMVEKHRDKVVIYVKAAQGPDADKDIRFIAVKELSHGLIDDSDENSSDGVRTLEYLLEEYRVIKDVNAETVAQSEVLAELAAIELTYPYGERCSDIGKLNDANDPLTTRQISDFYKIPEFIVERACEQWFHDLATTIWRLVDQVVEEERAA